MFKINKNLHPVDRGVRGLIGLFCTGLGVFGNELIGDPIVQGILVIFGLANLMSLAFGWCVVYQIVGISTSK